MDEPGAIFAFCDTCKEETAHRVLRGRSKGEMGSGFEGTVQCMVCKDVRKVQVPEERPVKVRSIISDGKESKEVRIELFPKERITIGEEMLWEDHNLLVTSIETKGKRPMSSEAKELDCLWLKVYDTLKVKVSIVKGAVTKAETVDATPEEEFFVGDLLEFSGGKVIIEKIKVEEGTIYRDDVPVQARHIKRVFTKPVRERYY